VRRGLGWRGPTAPAPDFGTDYVNVTFPNTVNGADHNAKAFGVQVSKTNDFAELVKDVTVDQQAGDSTKTTYRVDGLGDG